MPAPTPTSIASYGDGRLDFMPDGMTPGAADYEERLRALGYVE